MVFTFLAWLECFTWWLEIFIDLGHISLHYVARELQVLYGMWSRVVLWQVEKNKYHWWWDLLLVIGLCAHYTIDVEVSAFTLYREFVSLLLVIGLCAYYDIDVEVNAFTLHRIYVHGVYHACTKNLCECAYKYLYAQGMHAPVGGVWLITTWKKKCIAVCVQSSTG